MRREEEEQRKVQEALKAARSEWEADRLRKERIEMEEERRKSIERRAMEEAAEARRAAEARLAEMQRRQAEAQENQNMRIREAQEARAAAEAEAAERRQQLAAGQADLAQLRRMAEERERQVAVDEEARVKNAVAEARKQWELEHAMQVLEATQKEAMAIGLSYVPRDASAIGLLTRVTPPPLDSDADAAVAMAVEADGSIAATPLSHHASPPHTRAFASTDPSSSTTLGPPPEEMPPSLPQPDTHHQAFEPTPLTNLHRARYANQELIDARGLSTPDARGLMHTQLAEMQSAVREATDSANQAMERQMEAEKEARQEKAAAASAVEIAKGLRSAFSSSTRRGSLRPPQRLMRSLSSIRSARCTRRSAPRMRWRVALWSSSPKRSKSRGSGRTSSLLWPGRRLNRRGRAPRFRSRRRRRRLSSSALRSKDRRWRGRFALRPRMRH